jgi:hypothetical protein
MKPRVFDTLSESIREAGEIMRGERRPARVRTADEVRRAVARLERQRNNSRQKTPDKNSRPRRRVA